MDWNNLKDTVAGMSLYDVKAGVRKVQNAVMNYTEMEAKVREATNNEPWGASSTTMQEIANGTFNYSTLNEIMPMIYRRFTEKAAEEWRQIYKALQLLEFLIKHGSERVIDDARGHITLLKMLRQFHFIDQNGKDQGINVRNRAKELTELLSDVERIRSERKKARATKNKYTGVEGGAGGGFSGSSGGGRYGGFGSESGGTSAANFGGYSGGVYGDGGGFGGQSDEWREGGSGAGGSSSRGGDRFEAYDEAPQRKKKEPEVDLFSFDEPASSSSAPPAPASAQSSAFGGLSTLSAPAAASNDDDDEFDDFVSAPQTGIPSAAPVTAAASSTATFAAPKPLQPQQQADLSNIVNLASPAPSTASGPNYSSFATPAMASPATQAPKMGGYQPAGPNYFGSVQSAAPQQTGSAVSMGSSMGATKPAQSAAAKPAAAGGDAFGALWSQASSGIKKTNTSTGQGPAMGQLAKEKSSAGIWGAQAGGSTTAAKPTSSSNGLDDLLG
ncbi:epsin-3 [Verticillium alfalfae VaMs.102]|uniref:Epsin-3 n=1 Tax=Verticillium alfalfae (strain VaMs.102 / ATCC MYA-4576 / FGSC 10136) TaxID=526221 RepID=C9SYJ3_VERA1|nr:epsin-3 [Verticillium alfalfae VaMs.102]EEY23858.1 epsin-3 [Verticillium alfalfae VaMs.102]